MIDDIIKSIRASLYDRTSSPLFGAFFTSWLVWNHRMIFVLFAAMPVSDKFRYIDEELYVGVWYTLGFLAAGPLLTALAFLFLYPYPAKLVYEFWREKQKELKAIRQRIEDETPLTQEESKRLRHQMIQLQAQYDVQVGDLSDKVNQFTESLAGAKKAEEDLTMRLAEIQQKNDGSATESTFRDSQLESVLVGNSYRLVHNPQENRSKKITFRMNGELGGGNKNEHSWRVSDGRLELLQSDGKVHSRFEYIARSGILAHTNDPDTLSARDQFIVPEPA